MYVESFSFTYALTAQYIYNRIFLTFADHTKRDNESGNAVVQDWEHFERKFEYF